MSLKLRMALTLIAATVIGIALGAIVLTTRQTALAAALLVTGAGLVGMLGLWTNRRVTGRLARMLEISAAWLRGNLSLRIADSSADELSQLAGQLDRLAEHLAQDEQDLAELRERNARLTDQVRALAVVEERNRLARELHDSVKQHLFSLAMTASAIRARFDALPEVPQDLFEMVREVEKAAQTAQRETTRLIEDLRPGSLQEQGLAKALNDYTLLFGAQEHLLVYLDVQGDDTRLPPSVTEALYRVTQEALHNVARHARATRADVHLRCIPGQATLTIRDNGIGFDTSRPRRGLGLANMQERVLDIGGRLSVASQPGTGTTVLAQIGLSRLPYTPTELIEPDQRRPRPTIENWPWLGQKLVIPVGQTWPWLPADQLHLRRPVVEPNAKPLTFSQDTGLLGLKKGYVLQTPHSAAPLVWVHRGRSGYEWESEGASWALRYVSGLKSRMVLTRNGQPLAAMQYRGRTLHTWTELIYDGHGYCLSHVQDRSSCCVLADQTGEELLSITDALPAQITLRRALPLPLLIIATVRVFDEMSEPTAAIDTGT